LPQLIAELLVQRGVRSADEARRFFKPSLDDLNDPYLLTGMDRAVSRLQQAAREREPVLIYGDYDVDGTTATVLLKTALERLGAVVRYHIPHRIKDGYGMQTPVLAAAAAEGVRVVVSVDTGIRAFEVASEAALLGLDLIVTDHHLPDASRGVPEAIAVLNPNQAGCAYPCKHLCGAGVAFKLAQALLEAHDRELARTKLLPSFLKLLAIATIADAVPLLGENRTIVQLGLKELRRPVNKGLRHLFALAKIDLEARSPSAMDIAFGIAPRINAAGRMDIATDVVELFTTQDADRAVELAEKVHRLNTERRATEKEIVERVATQMDAAGENKPAFLVAEGEGWHRGVLGIVASRMVERWQRPALVMSHEDGEAHGSGRSMSGFHLLDALTSCAELFTRFGGHAQAVGFSLPSGNTAELTRRLNDYARESVGEWKQGRVLEYAAEIPLSKLTREITDYLLAMEPFGMGNPQPVFVARNVCLRSPAAYMPVGGPALHVRLRVADADGSQMWRAVGWRMADEARGVCDAQNARVDIAYTLRQNEHPEWGGLELELAGIAPATAVPPA
jgi:single-stranded-DNA-specific exonuclease